MLCSDPSPYLVAGALGMLFTQWLIRRVIKPLFARFDAWAARVLENDYDE